MVCEFVRTGIVKFQISILLQIFYFSNIFSQMESHCCFIGNFMNNCIWYLGVRIPTNLRKIFFHCCEANMKKKKYQRPFCHLFITIVQLVWECKWTFDYMDSWRTQLEKRKKIQACYNNVYIDKYIYIYVIWYILLYGMQFT